MTPTPFRVVLVAGCAYEIVAVVSDRVPTITSIVKAIGAHSFAGRVLVWLWAGAWAWHFMEPGP